MYLGKKLLTAKNFLIILVAGILLSISLAVYSFNCNQKEIEFKVYGKGIYVVSIDSDYFAKNSDIYVSKNLETVESAAKENKAKVAINAGFFDPKNEKTTSYIVKNSEIIENPENNENLVQNLSLKEYLPTIFNRSEFRQMACRKYAERGLYSLVYNSGQNPDKVVYDIAQRTDSILDPDQGIHQGVGCRIVYSVQAGPELVPNFDLEKEFFILKKDGKVIRESASALHKVARSALGITKDRILLVAASNDNPMTLEELSCFMKKIGSEQAMAFDGGSSTSLYMDIPEKKDFILNSAKDNSARRVKSILIVR